MGGNRRQSGNRVITEQLPNCLIASSLPPNCLPVEERGMPEREISSLDRLLVRHAPAALDTMRARVLGIVGSIYSAVGLGAVGIGIVGALVGSGAAFVALPGA